MTLGTCLNKMSRENFAIEIIRGGSDWCEEKANMFIKSAGICVV